MLDPNLFSEEDEARAQRRYLVRLILFILFVVLGGLALGSIISKARAAPMAMNATECALVGDMTLVAAALGRHRLAAETRAAVMEDMYAVPLGGEDAARWRAILQAAVRLAARKELADAEPHELAASVAHACVLNRGDLGTIFGDPI